MSSLSFDYRNFYGSRGGRIVRRVIGAHIRDLWPECRALRVAGLGYAQPYLSFINEGCERSFALSTPDVEIHAWPEEGRNLSALCDEDKLPLETESIDRLLVVHGMERARQPADYLFELWRVLKSNGRLLLIVPNRHGLWSHAEWSPFGHGHPYTVTQITGLMRQALFSIERVERALYMPPLRSFPLLSMAYTFESFGKYCLPGMHGLLMIEAGKQVYSGVRAGAVSQREPARRALASPASS